MLYEYIYWIYEYYHTFLTRYTNTQEMRLYVESYFSFLRTMQNSILKLYLKFI